MPTDPVKFELFKNAPISGADEMALTIFRMTCFGLSRRNIRLTQRWHETCPKLG